MSALLGVGAFLPATPRVTEGLTAATDHSCHLARSVLEPGRTLTLAEKGGAGAEEITAAPGFRLVATMNPGGDYGKRELSPALSNRFTTVWVPPIEDFSELAALLNARLASERPHPACTARKCPQGLNGMATRQRAATGLC